MQISQALDLISRYDATRNPLTSLGDFLDPELIAQCLAQSGTVTLRKRRLPLAMMVWCLVGMALERKEPLHQSLSSCINIASRFSLTAPFRRSVPCRNVISQDRLDASGSAGVG